MALLLSEVNTLIQVDWRNAVIVIFALVIGAQKFGSAAEWINNKAGFTTRRQRNEEQEAKTVKSNSERIEALERNYVTILDAIHSLSEKFDMHERNNSIDRVKRIKYEILDSACRLSTMDFSREQYNHLYDIHKEYEGLIKDNEIPNGQLEASFKYIEERYAEQLKKGFLYEGKQ